MPLKCTSRTWAGKVVQVSTLPAQNHRPCYVGVNKVKESDMHEQTIQTYQGWSNRETWLASLWLNNDEQSAALLGFARKQPGDTFAQAEWLEGSMRFACIEYVRGASLFTDLLDTAFSRIDWLEVLEKS